jgi:uncharacterized iron-regulated membrane protein
MAARNPAFRRFLLNVHLWIGIGLAVLIIPISISGALLVWHDTLDSWINPSRYAVSAGSPLQPSVYVASASKAFDPGAQIISIRFPEDRGAPVIVAGRQRSAEGAPPRFLNAYIDPPTGRVLDVVDGRASLFGFLHRFHENLTIPEYSGRAVVGWVGVAMLISSLSGIYLWWPRNVAFTRGLRWRRTPATTTNLHHLFGFWISIPLAVVSLTGIYLGFPQQARDVLASVAPMNAPLPRPFNTTVARQTSMTADQALERLLASSPGSEPAVLFLAATPQGRSQSEGQTQPAPLWRAQLRNAKTGAVSTVFLDDQTLATRSAPAAQTGDSIAQWIRWIHEGSHSGFLWQIIVFLCGSLPSLFVVTGVIMWLRGRTGRKVKARSAKPQMSPAE